MYIENTFTLAILQIPYEYRKIFHGSESTDMLGSCWKIRFWISIYCAKLQFFL